MFQSPPNFVFAASPARGPSVPADIVSPPAIWDNDDADTMRKRVKEAYAYERALKARRLISQDISLKDLDEAETYKISAILHTMVPNIARSVIRPPGDYTAALATITAISSEMESIELSLQRVSTIQRNATSRYLADAVNAPRNDSFQPVPPEFPRTIEMIMSLTAEQLHAIETYYSMPHDGDDDARRKAVLDQYGVVMAVL
jgi:hypothetical protein